MEQQPIGDGWCTGPMTERDASIAEGDEANEAASDNSLGRLLALSDGVFAIAMTLLALDLRLPDLSTDASDAQLRHALADDWRSYLAFLISFYVVANYWGVHRQANILVLLLCIPGAFVLEGNAPWLLLLLIVSGRAPRIRRTRHKAQA